MKFKILKYSALFLGIFIFIFVLNTLIGWADFSQNSIQKGIYDGITKALSYCLVFCFGWIIFNFVRKEINIKDILNDSIFVIIFRFIYWVGTLLFVSFILSGFLNNSQLEIKNVTFLFLIMSISSFIGLLNYKNKLIK